MNKKENTKKAYVAPTVEVMEAKVEHGFAGSGSLDINYGQSETVYNEDAIYF